MSVKIRLHPFFYGLAGGQEMLEVEGKNVGECLKALVTRFPSIEKELFGKNGKLHNYIEIYANEKSTYPQELAYKVNDGDVVSLIIFASGG